MTKTNAGLTVTIAAVKKTKHGAYGKPLGASVTVRVADSIGWETRAHEAALPQLKAMLPGVKIGTAVTHTSQDQF